MPKSVARFAGFV